MKLLAKNDVPEILQQWSQRYEVLCPGTAEQGDCIFGAFRRDSFTLDYRKPAMPPKASLLPPSQVLFTVDKGRYAAALSAGAALLFGVRACDAMGMLQTRSFFQRDCPDSFVGSRADGTVIIVNACSGPQNETCFCTTMKSGPCADRGFDLQLYDLGEAFLVEEGSGRGAELARSRFFSGVNDAEAAASISAFKCRAHTAIPLVADVPRAMDWLRAGQPCDRVWERLGAKCIMCGGCAYVCPTCTCFTVSDRVHSAMSGQRIRSWDACLFSGFTREASGHNPRPSQALRLRRRHEHKLLYYSVADAQGMTSGCVGCGRCSDYCPVHIGTLEVAKEIAEQACREAGPAGGREP